MVKSKKKLNLILKKDDLFSTKKEKNVPFLNAGILQVVRALKYVCSSGLLLLLLLLVFRIIIITIIIITSIIPDDDHVFREMI